MKVSFSLLLLLTLLTKLYSQEPEDKVGQVLAAENYFNAIAQNKGLKKAFLDVSDENTRVFRPGPLLAREYYKAQPDSLGYLSLDPIYAKIAKSADWGFTCGPYVFKRSNTDAQSFYGTYVSIWKKNKRNIWKLAFDAGISHKKPATELKRTYISPSNQTFLHQKSNSRLKQREDIVLSSDKLLSTVTKADNRIAQNEFLTENSWLLFPGTEPLIGKKAIMEFWKSKGYKAITEPAMADRAYSGEIACTYGEASILAKKYHYLRIWEVQPGYKWNVILELFTEAE
ncbi:hypothetical protein [Pararcticibacter amylolyticus]|uniref:DUF4440 domain-containing protein n=1 Tax=Pararcticibacter amylolyticus TaxID=2173175 RepID=A0A2U2PDJ5_9SPHI|nr:hypothetical protein [Pararcticibacter amylolyticus]PWG79443.1 hypothetical protein DDR33_16925 [Pararcticibacter amylolyticus]